MKISHNYIDSNLQVSEKVNPAEKSDDEMRLSQDHQVLAASFQKLVERITYYPGMFHWHSNKSFHTVH